MTELNDRITANCLKIADEVETLEHVFWDCVLVMSFRLKNGFCFTTCSPKISPEHFDLNEARKKCVEDLEIDLYGYEAYRLTQVDDKD